MYLGTLLGSVQCWPALAKPVIFRAISVQQCRRFAKPRRATEEQLKQSGSSFGKYVKDKANKPWLLVPKNEKMNEMKKRNR
jgi:hypothetical protein